MTELKSECAINVAYGSSSAGGLPVSVGVPFPQGKLCSVEKLCVESPNGDFFPAAGRSLITWPDGSIRWCLVSFGAREAGRHILHSAGEISTSGPQLWLRQADGNWSINNQQLRVTVSEKGPAIFSELTINGKSLLENPESLHFCVDDASTRYETRRTVNIIEETPLRIRLRVAGAHFRADGSRRLNYRLDIEVWAGCPALRLDYHYFNLEPNHPSLTVDRIALESEWRLDDLNQRHFVQSNHGLFYMSRHVLNPDPVGIVADFSHSSAHVEDPAMLRDDFDYPFYLHPPLVKTQDWLGLGDRDLSIYVKVQDFLAARPNRLHSSGKSLKVELWPATADPCELPQGRSRRQTIVLAFPAEGLPEDTPVGKVSCAPVQGPTGVGLILDAPLHEGRATVASDWIAQCREFQQFRLLPAGCHVRIENNLREFMQLHMPNSKFDVGDTDSHYNNGYVLINENMVPRLPGAPELPRQFPRNGPTQTYLDLHEPVWTNNEYDAIHALASELMRTERSDLWNLLRLAARHNIEVDFLHYSDHKWLHRATPAHSVRHTTTGAYPSHFWTQGLLEYYCLSGDPDGLEVAMALGDKTIENFSDPAIRSVSWGFNREIGWSILLLVCLVEITGEKRFRPCLDEMVNYIISFDRDNFKGGINLSNGNDRQSLNRQIVGNFFGYSSMIDGIDRYADLSGRPEVVEWLGRFCLDLAEAAMQAAREGQLCEINFSIALAVGFERTGKPRFLELAGLLLDSLYWNRPGLTGGGSAKPVAKAYRGFPRLLGHAWRHGWLEQYEFPSLRKLQDQSNPG